MMSQVGVSIFGIIRDISNRWVGKLRFGEIGQ